jgi:serine phosphatase RsbU (regulator of sigma subunit)
MCKYYWILLWVFLPYLAYGQVGERVMVLRPDNIERGIGYNANKYTYTFEDKAQKLTFEDVLQKDFYQKMQITNWRYDKLYKPNTYYWYKTTITNQNKTGDIEFTYEPSNGGRQEFRILHNGKITTKYSGEEIPASKRDLSIHPRAISFQIAYKDTITIVCRAERYIMLTSSKDIWIGKLEPYREAYISQTVANVFFQGALWIMFCYNLLFFFIIRDRAYLYYSLYIGCMAWFFANHYLPNYIPESEFPELRMVTRLIVLIPTFFYVLFVARFLNFKQESPYLYRLFNYWKVLRLSVVPFLAFFIPIISEEIGNVALEVLVITDMLVSFAVLLSNYQKRKGLTTYMILGLLALALPVFIGFTVRYTGYEQYWFQDMIAVGVGIALEIILFSLGLGYRSNLTEKEKTQAQQQLIVQLEENERLIKEQNVVLEQKVTERTLELKQSNEELNSTLETVAKQRDDIIASINYARRIQTALLPAKATIQVHLPEYMLFYLPKDIVSGDFYWFSQIAGKTFLAIADCTGHGVPGAFMTVIGENLLDQIVNKDAIYSPAHILTELDTRLLKTLQQQGINTETVNDGMDISLLQIDLPTRKIVWAGAKRPLWVFEAGKDLPTEYKGDKFPIGSGQFKDKIFTEKEIQLQKDDMVYAFTDGFADQFGAEGKLTVRRFRELFHVQPFEEQERILAQKLQTWRGAETQTDDVLVIAIQF